VWWWKPYVASKVAVTRDMDATMSQKTKKEVLEKLRRCYHKAGPEYRIPEGISPHSSGLRLRERAGLPQQMRPTLKGLH